MFTIVRIPRCFPVEKRLVGPLGTFRSPFRVPSSAFRVGGACTSLHELARNFAVSAAWGRSTARPCSQRPAPGADR